MQCIRVGYRGICHASLVFSVYTHEPLGEYVYEENTSDKWHVQQYPTRITSMYCIILYYITLRYIT